MPSQGFMRGAPSSVQSMRTYNYPRIETDSAYRWLRGDIPPFERVIIETSGVADPAPLLNVLLGHPLVTAAYAFDATVCAIDAQHFLASRSEYPEPDKQAALAERIYVTKRDLADPAA